MQDRTVAAKYGPHDIRFTSERTWDRPLRDVELTVTFTAPSGKRTSRPAFWDGGTTWKARFSPDEVGRWRWESSCSVSTDRGLHARRGQFTCTASTSLPEPLRHGPIKRSADGRYLVHADGTPFFWMADTAWNGALNSHTDDWQQYLRTRREQGFTVIQCVATHWRAYNTEQACTTYPDGIEPNVALFQRLDSRLQAINKAGLIAAPVLLWAMHPADPGLTLSDAEALRLTRYMVARWGAWNVVWFLAGDGNYGGPRAERWRTLGRAALTDCDRAATMHPGGGQWITEEFRNEPWYTFAGYQSGHSDSEATQRWLVSGPPANGWKGEPRLPVINLEPCYEAIGARPIPAYPVRKALYRSLLNAPTAGVSYGHHGIWPWTETPEVPLNHPGSGVSIRWSDALRAEGATNVQHLSWFFRSIRWWTLDPDRSLLIEPSDLPSQFISASRSQAGDLAVIYMPSGGELRLDTKQLKRNAAVEWLNPRTGARTRAGRVTGTSLALTAPDADDWVLCIRA